ncbi:pyrokinin-1 receptor-like [Mya arenaria]|uniref:pyrokinin-1 receptor-like n=1 Tax=Mya arenaria TaxID=6604 RepID=UPI0022E2FF8D|nr:pyrokinin-1 receptor-like [Mya arenaria]
MDLGSFSNYNITNDSINQWVVIVKENISQADLLLEKLGTRRKELPVTLFLLSVYGLMFISGVLGNVCTCVVILRNANLRTSTNYYLLSLAISDVLILITGLPPEAYSIWESYPWRFGKAFCIIKALFAEMTSYASVLTITAFTIERYIAICKPLESHKIVAFSRCVKIIIAIWIISLCCALPYPIHTDVFYYVSDSNGTPILDSLQCNIPHQYSERMRHVFQLSTFVFFVFPLTVIIVLYSLIGLTLRRAEMRRETTEQCHQSGSRSSSNRNQAHRERGPTFIARRSVLKVLVAVVVAFFVCWAPFHAQRLLTVYNTDWTPRLLDFQSSLFYVSGVLYFIGSTVNPILYNVMSRRYRLAFLETICHSKTRRSIGSYKQTNGYSGKLRSTKLSLKENIKSPANLDNHGDHFFAHNQNAQDPFGPTNLIAAENNHLKHCLEINADSNGGQETKYKSTSDIFPSANQNLSCAYSATIRSKPSRSHVHWQCSDQANGNTAPTDSKKSTYNIQYPDGSKVCMSSKSAEFYDQIFKDQGDFV